MVEVERYLWRSSGLLPLVKQGHLQSVIHDHVLMFCASPGMEVAQHPWAACVSVQLPVSVKKCFLRFRANACVSVFAY